MRKVLLLAASALFAPSVALADGPYTQTVFFGDSLTDGGFYELLLPLSVRPVAGQYTTNPGFVWSQWVADYYGTGAIPNGNGQSGTNYAAGGARVGVNTTGSLGPIPSLATQMSNYLIANGGQADPSALYTVWGGMTDLRAITDAGAPVVPTLTNAVASEVGIVSALHAAGARYIVVVGTQDLGVTPYFRSLGSAAQAEATALSSLYNASLFSELANNNLRVIPVDAFKFFNEVVANPGAFGFTNFTGTACEPQITANSLVCGPTNLIDPTAPDTYVFADGVNPTTATHKMLSQLALSALEAPRQIAVLPRSEQVTGRARAERVAAHVVGKPSGDGMRWWVDGRADIQSADGDHGELYNGTAPGAIGGVDWISGNTVFGAFAGFGHGSYDFGNDAGDFKQSDVSLGAFFGWYGDQVWANAQLSFSLVGYDVDRKVQLGPVTRIHAGSPDGTNVSLAVNTGFNMGEGPFKHGPLAGLLAQQIDVDGYSESNPGLSTALAYPDQSYGSLIGFAGYQASFNVTDSFAPYVKVTYDHEFTQNDEEAFARSLSVAGSLPYAVPGLDFDRSYGTATVGARADLFGLDANIGVSTTIAQDRATNTTVFATFSKGF